MLSMYQRKPDRQGITPTSRGSASLGQAVFHPAAFASAAARGVDLRGARCALSARDQKRATRAHPCARAWRRQYASKYAASHVSGLIELMWPEHPGTSRRERVVVSEIGRAHV